MGERHRRLPERGRHLHRLHDALVPRQVHAVHGQGQLGAVAANVTRFTYGPILKHFRNRNMDKKYDLEPDWRKPGKQLTTGYQKRW